MQQSEGQSMAASSLPQGAVRVDPSEILKVQHEMIQKWRPRSDMWPFTTGSGCLGALSGLTGIILNHQFRKAFKLRHFSRFSSYLPLVVVPTIGTMIIQSTFVTNAILARQFSCPVCAEVRASCIQLTFGLIQPMILAPLASSAVARQRYTFPVPKVTNFRGQYELFIKTVSPIKGTLLVLFAAHMVGAMVITQKQGQAAMLLWNKISDKYTFRE